jgi:hypothetical protein
MLNNMSFVGMRFKVTSQVPQITGTLYTNSIGVSKIYMPDYPTLHFPPFLFLTSLSYSFFSFPSSP